MLDLTVTKHLLFLLLREGISPLRREWLRAEAEIPFPEITRTLILVAFLCLGPFRLDDAFSVVSWLSLGAGERPVDTGWLAEEALLPCPVIQFE